MSDPKYFIKNGALYHEDNYELPDDEPLMIFRGKDVGSIIAILAYIEMLEGETYNSVIESHYLSSIERLDAFYNYQINNPELQSVGCSNANHGDAEHYLELAKCKLKQLGVYKNG